MLQGFSKPPAGGRKGFMPGIFKNLSSEASGMAQAGDGTLDVVGQGCEVAPSILSRCLAVWFLLKHTQDVTDHNMWGQEEFFSPDLIGSDLGDFSPSFAACWCGSLVNYWRYLPTNLQISDHWGHKGECWHPEEKRNRRQRKYHYKGKLF